VLGMQKWSKIVATKFSNEDLQRLKAVASQKGMPMTTYVRSVVLESLQKEEQNHRGDI